MILGLPQEGILPSPQTRNSAGRLASSNASEQREEGVERHFIPTVRLASSIRLGWTDIIVERFLTDPGEKPEEPTSRHVVALAAGPAATFGERPGFRGRLVPFTKNPGTMHLYPQGLIPAIYPFVPTELIVCVLDTKFVEEVAEEQETGKFRQLQQHRNFVDEPSASLVRLLEQEAKSDGRSGRLYAEHLSYALAARLLSLDTQRKAERASKNALSGPRLRRVLERMEADLSSELDLKTLAAESGYSRNHFLRMFSQATKSTPHRYLIHLRVKRAKAMLRDKSLRMIDIALACGFSSDAHLSRVFHQVAGVTPSEYRRNIR
jgi:AraC family transcriptional regulator